MNVLIIGLGSMGFRRARLVKQYDDSINIIGVDINAERRKKAECELKIMTKESIQAACEDFACDAAFISTSPLSHASIINECLKRNLHVFTELNLVADGYDDNIKLADDYNKVLFLSSTFLYRKEIEFIKREVSSYDGCLSYVYHVGQYLPDWHPWENYKNFFVGDRRTSGCREIMAIEFPWLVDVFGKVKSIKTSNSKISSLDIDYPDTYQMILEHNSGHRGIVVVDIVSRKAERKFEMFGENSFITWNGTPESLFKYNLTTKESDKINLYSDFTRKEGYEKFIIEDAYYNQIVDFFDSIYKASKPRYSFKKDKEVISLIDLVEGSNDNE